MHNSGVNQEMTENKYIKAEFWGVILCSLESEKKINTRKGKKLNWLGE